MVFRLKTASLVDMNFAFSPLSDTSGYQQSEPANVADVGWGGLGQINPPPHNAVLP